MTDRQALIFKANYWCNDLLQNLCRLQDEANNFAEEFHNNRKLAESFDEVSNAIGGVFVPLAILAARIPNNEVDNG